MNMQFFKKNMVNPISSSFFSFTPVDCLLMMSSIWFWGTSLALRKTDCFLGSTRLFKSFFQKPYKGFFWNNKNVFFLLKLRRWYYEWSEKYYWIFEGFTFVWNEEYGQFYINIELITSIFELDWHSNQCFRVRKLSFECWTRFDSNL